VVLPPARIQRIGAAFVLFVIAAAVATWLCKPLHGGPAGPDAAASILFFDRIVTGTRLETFVNTTPKPLLTVILGGLHGITGGWVAGALATVLATALAVVLAAEVVRRVAGIEAAAFAAVALIGLLSLQVETSLSYGLPWAFLLWMAAGLLLLRPEPRYGLAGSMLLLAGLARPETWIIVGVGMLLLLWRAVRGPRPPREAWLLLIAWLALPVLCVHDFLLTGIPLWWIGIARHSVELAGGRASSLPTVLHMSADLLLGMLPMVIAACAGGLLLVRRQSWIAVAGLVAMGPLILVYTWLLSIEHINVLSHYLHPAELAIVLAAAVGVGLVLAAGRGRLATARPRASGPLAVGVACVVAVALAVVMARPFTPLSRSARTSTALESRIALRLEAVEPVLDGLLPADRSGPAVNPGPMGAPDPALGYLFVPAHHSLRLSIDLRLPLTRLLGLEPAHVDLAGGYPPVGSVVYLDGIIEPATVSAATTPLQVSVPTVVGGVRVVPIVSDPAAKTWIVRIEPAP